MSTATVLLGTVLLALPQSAAPQEAALLHVEPLHGLRAEAAARLLSGGTGGNLPASIAFGRPRQINPSGGLRVPLTVEIPAHVLGPSPPRPGGEDTPRPQPEPASPATSDPPDEEPASLEIYCYVLDASLAVRGHLAEKLVAGGAQLPKGVRYRSAVELEASDSAALSLRLLVLEPRSGRLVQYVEPLDPAGGTTLRLVAPTALDATDWLTVTGSGPRAGSGARDPDDGSLTSLPVLVPGPQRLQVQGGRGRRGEAELALTREGRQDEAPAAVPARFEDRGSALVFQLPELPSGRYTWRLDESPASTGRLWILGAEAAADARTLAGSSAGAEALDWLDAERWYAERASLAARLELTDIDQVAPATRLQSQYATLLRNLGTHWDAPRAVSDLTRVELAAQDAKLDIPTIERLELDVLASLVERSPEAALVALAVHVTSYRTARDERRYADAGRHRRTVRRVGAQVARRSPPLRGEVADQLSLLALVMSDDALWPGVQHVLEQVVGIQPEHPPARALLALVLEHQGKTEEAIGHAETAFELDRGLHANRLRLAVLLRRLGRDERAESHLRALLDESPQDSERVVACQELSRLLAARERFGDATDVLERCRAGNARASELVPQLVHVLERRGQTTRARQLRSEDAPRPGAPSARLLYSRVPASVRSSLQSNASRGFRMRVTALTAAFGEQP